MLRVFATDEMFDAVETLARARPLRGDRLAILTNGGGPGVMATDAPIGGGGRLAELSGETMTRLDAVLPPFWSHGNPVDIIGDAGAERYASSLSILLAAPEVDAVLVMHAPTAVASSEAAARAVVAIAEEAAGKAVRAFLHMVHYRRNQEILTETPPSAPAEFAPVIATARRIVEGALADGRSLLSEAESKELLAAYGVPVVETRIASSPEEAVRLADELDYPVALKILSPDISHKSDVGGVVLDLGTPEAVQTAARAMRARVCQLLDEHQRRGFEDSG